MSVSIIDTPGLIQHALFENRFGMESLIKSIPKNDSSWHNFDNSLRAHAKSLYHSHNIDKMVIPLDCLLLTLILYTLQKIPSVDTNDIILRFNLVKHGDDIFTTICSKYDTHYKNNNSILVAIWIWYIFHKEKGFSTPWYVNDISEEPDAETGNNTATTHTNDMFECICRVLKDHSSKEICQNYFISKFCNGYNILPTLKAKYAHFLCKEARAQRYIFPDLTNQKIGKITHSKLTSQQRSQIMKKEHQYWTQAFDICISKQYSLKKTEYFGTLLVKFLLFDLMCEMSLNLPNLDVIYAFPRDILRQIRTTIKWLITHYKKHEKYTNSTQYSQVYHNSWRAQLYQLFAVLSYLHIPIIFDESFLGFDYDFKDWYKFRRIINRYVIPYFKKSDKIEETIPVAHVAQRRQRIENRRNHRKRHRKPKLRKVKFKKTPIYNYWVESGHIDQYLRHITERYQLLMNSSMLVMDWDLFDQCFTKWKRLSIRYGHDISRFQSAVYTKCIARDSEIYGKKACDLDILHEQYSIGTYLVSKRKFTKQLQTKPLNQFLMKTFDVNCRKKNNDKYYNGWKNTVLMKECNVCCKKTGKLRKCKDCHEHAFYCSIKCQKIDWNQNNHKRKH